MILSHYYSVYHFYLLGLLYFFQNTYVVHTIIIIFHIGFIASRVSDRQVSHLVQQILRFLQLKHGSLLKAALGSSQDLNNVIGKLLYDTLFGRALRTEMSRNLEALIDQVPMLHLPDDIQFQVEDALNQFESSDFQVSTYFTIRLILHI